MAKSLGPLDEMSFRSDVQVGGTMGITKRDMSLLDFVEKANMGEDTPSLDELDEMAKNGTKIRDLDSVAFRLMYEKSQEEAKLRREGPQGIDRR